MRRLLLLLGLLVLTTPVRAQIRDTAAWEHTVTGWTRCFQGRMRLEGWNLSIAFINDSTGTFYAKTGWRLENNSATVYYNRVLLLQTTARFQRRVVVHELMHLHTAALYFLAMHFEPVSAELSVERISELAETWPVWDEQCHSEDP